MTEQEEFAEALIGQISVELDEEKEIAELSQRISDDPSFSVEFDKLEELSNKMQDELSNKIFQLTGINVPEVSLLFPELDELKRIKGGKIHTSEIARPFVDELFDAISKLDVKRIAELIEKDLVKFLVYSTYARSYISKITTTYGDYLDSKIFLNKFILDRYPKIILHKLGIPYDARFDEINSAYRGAVKMALVENLGHAIQNELQQKNQAAVIEVNQVLEELAEKIIQLDDETVTKLSEYLQLEPIPDEFATAKRANLYFVLNPDNFLIEALGPEIMTYTNLEIDPKISELAPFLLNCYKKWLTPIQKHHAIFSVIGGISDILVQKILESDDDFKSYFANFQGTNFSSFKESESEGVSFVKQMFEKLGNESFKTIITNPPNTRELKNPQSYLNRIKP